MHQRLQVFVDLCQFLHLLRIFRLYLKHLLNSLDFIHWEELVDCLPSYLFYGWLDRFGRLWLVLVCRSWECSLADFSFPQGSLGWLAPFLSAAVAASPSFLPCFVSSSSSAVGSVSILRREQMEAYTVILVSSSLCSERAASACSCRSLIMWVFSLMAPCCSIASSIAEQHCCTSFSIFTKQSVRANNSLALVSAWWMLFLSLSMASSISTIVWRRISHGNTDEVVYSPSWISRATGWSESGSFVLLVSRSSPWTVRSTAK